MALREEYRVRISPDAHVERGHAYRCIVAPEMKEGEFFLMYQPKLDLRTGRVFGVEALLRWRHPLHGVLEPDEFIPLAEKAGIIAQLDTWAIEESCRQASLWQRRGEFSGSVAVNVSALDLPQARLVDSVRDALARHGVDPARLILEITESHALTDMDLTLKALGSLGGMGVRVALDDFGTGYSSLARLRDLPVSEIKLDRCFIRNLDRCDRDVAIVTAIIGIAKALGATVVGEGVETARQLAALSGLGCHAVQGYLIGRPMPPGELVRSVVELDRIVDLYDWCATREQDLCFFLFGDGDT